MVEGVGGESMPHPQLERVARWTPLFIVVYFAVQFLIRVLFSANLEIDEFEFVGQTYLALGYGNSHPPLYNWLVAGALALTGGHWPVAVALVKNLLLVGTYLLAFDTMRRITGQALSGLIVVVSFLLLPQIVWKAQITLSHTVLVMFAVVAVMHALVCIVQRGDRLSFVWLGLAAAAGALAKYNFPLMLVALFISAFSIPYLRERLFKRALALSAATLFLLFSPHLIWAVLHVQETTERMAKLERDNSAFGALDLPWLGIDGLIGSVVAVAAWAAPLVLVWVVIAYLNRNENSTASKQNERAAAFAKLFGLSAALGLAAFALIVLAGDLHIVHERYMTPMLMALPMWLVLTWPLEASARAPKQFLRVGAVIAVLMTTAWPAWIAFGKEQFAFPYRSFAAALDASQSKPLVILAQQRKYAANIAIWLSQVRFWEDDLNSDKVLLLWEPKSMQPPKKLMVKLGDRFEARGEVMTMSYPYENFSGEQARLYAQLYARKP